jgi:branched-chain amino acid transport system substrate-binding protein
MTPQMNAQSISRWVFGNLSNSWFLLVVDYEWGHQNRDVCLEFAEKNKVKIKGVIKFPLGSGRFTQYFPKILRSKAETLIVASWGTDQLAFVDQAAKGGLKKKLSIVNTLSELTIAQKMDPSAAAGMYWGANFYWGLSEQIPSARQFVNDFKKAFKVFPTGYAGYAYSGVKELLWALEQSKEYPVQPDKITALLEARTYDHYKGKQWWRPCDHQSFQDLYILKFKGPEERKGPNDFAEVLGSVSWDMGIERTCEELGHKEHLWGHALKKTL